MIQAILTDIEGTTTSLSFVHEVLFPFARARIAGFVRAQIADPRVAELLLAAAELANVTQTRDPARVEAIITALETWSDADRKITPLKALQGLVWEAGYRQGEIKGHIYPDVATQLRGWHQHGCKLYVYSSGSVLAQKLLFGHTEYGDLTPLFSGYFDTTTGGKREADSYRKIAAAIGLPAADILFLSDVVAELDGAQAAGMPTLRVLREGVSGPSGLHPVAQDFTGVTHWLDQSSQQTR